MPVHAHVVADLLDSISPAQPGLYVESGINGTIVATVFDAAGTQIRQDHIAAEHFDPETLEALTRWANQHRELPAKLKLG